MIKKLRIKFVIISMVSILIVLSIIMISINLSNYNSVANENDKILDTLFANGGDFIRNNEIPPKEDENKSYNYRPKNPEMMYETRFFTVKIKENEAGEKEYSVYMDFIKAIETEAKAIELANNALKLNKRGYIGIYRYLYGSINDETVVIFIDCQRGLDNAMSFLISSLIISALGYVGVFLLILLASRYVFRPVDEAYQKQKRFISNAQHELKTPLTIISANNELIEMIHGEDESTTAINKQIKKLNQMVSSLSLLSKLEEKNRLDKKEEFNLSKSILETIDDFTFDDKIKLDMNINDNILYIGEEGLIRQLISIVIDNAIKYHKSYIKIDLYKDSKNTIFEVINDCYDIEDGNHQEVFERFYRSDNIRSNVEGSGIGLSITKEIADLHKANIIASSINNNFKIKVTF